jgi:2-aminoadipate transaminase
MTDSTRAGMDYESFWVVPQLPVPAWQTERFTFDFGGANPGPDVMPSADLAEAARKVIVEEHDEIVRYPPTYGPDRLRELIVRKMRDHRGITWPNIDHVLVTNGSAQGISLGMQTLIVPGDVIITDRFFYQGAVRTFNASGAEVITVDRDDDGMRMDLLEETLTALKGRDKKPKFLYTIPSPQNPDGTIMPLERRQKMMSLAEEYDFLIMEDDCYVDQKFDVATMPHSIMSLDGGQDRVIYIATFSKIISPGVRVGWVTAAKPLLERMAGYKQDVGNDYLSGLIVAKYLEDHMDARIDWLNDRMRHKRDTMLAALGENFGPHVQVRIPAGGMFLFAKFADGVNMSELEVPSQERGVRYLGGPQFSPIGEGVNYARLNYSFPSVDEITNGIARLADVLREEGAIKE